MVQVTIKSKRKPKIRNVYDSTNVYWEHLECYHFCLYWKKLTVLFINYVFTPR